MRQTLLVRLRGPERTRETEGAGDELQAPRSSQTVRRLLSKPEGPRRKGGAITVDVHQVAHDTSTGELISDSRVRHREDHAGRSR